MNHTCQVGFWAPFIYLAISLVIVGVLPVVTALLYSLMSRGSGRRPSVARLVRTGLAVGAVGLIGWAIGWTVLTNCIGP
jgi:hypothetical protein